jgi:hypothetical protein
MCVVWCVVVSLSEGRKLALSLGWGFIETSALHNTNVDDVLINITREVQRTHASHMEGHGIGPEDAWTII